MCVLPGFNGQCQAQSTTNAENIRRLADVEDPLATYVIETTTNSNEMIHLLEKKPSNAIPAGIAATEDKKWVINQSQLRV